MAAKLRAAARRAIFESLERRDLLTAGPAAANVLVLYNAASADGTAIANYYAQVHPGVHLLALSGVNPSSENITADDYLATIRPQVMAALTPEIEVIVTTKGLPLRIQVTEAAPTAPFPNAPTYTDPQGIVRPIYNWHAYSSLESELTTIATVSTWQMMGDQSYWGIPGGHFTNNRYFGATDFFSRESYGAMYLTARLDGYTRADVLGAIDRAQNAFVGANNSNSGPYFLIDNDPSITYAPTMAILNNTVLAPAGLPVVYDNTSAFISTAPGPVIGYDSHGVHQVSTPTNYINTGLNITLANGAVFNSWESYNAYSFTPGVYGGTQGQVAAWLARGGTAAMGNVSEPGANTSRVANENLLFKSLLAGKTWVEAAWSSLAQLGYVNTVIGDPLMTWNRNSTVVDRRLFYNGSAWDGNSTAAGAADDLAIAPDKTAYLPGSGSAVFANVSSYTKGLNGLMVDIAGAHGAITAADFIFKTGNNNAPSTWATAPAPTLVTVRSGAGAGGADRIEILWANGAVRGTWLQIQLQGNDAEGGWNTITGLAATDTFYFGNAAGDSGAGDMSGFSVNSADETSARNDPHGTSDPATITNVNDFNRDRLVTAIDQHAARMYLTSALTQLKFLNIGASGPFAPLAVASSTASSPDDGDSGIASALAAAASAQPSGPAGGTAPPLKSVSTAIGPAPSVGCSELPPHDVETKLDVEATGVPAEPAIVDAAFESLGADLLID